MHKDGVGWYIQGLIMHIALILRPCQSVHNEHPLGVPLLGVNDCLHCLHCCPHTATSRLNRVDAVRATWSRRRWHAWCVRWRQSSVWDSCGAHLFVGSCGKCHPRGAPMGWQRHTDGIVHVLSTDSCCSTRPAACASPTASAALLWPRAGQWRATA